MAERQRSNGQVLAGAVSDTALTTAEMQALEFLADPHTMPREISSEPQMCAVMVFGELKRRGLAINEIGVTTIRWSLTAAGAALIEPKGKC